MMLFLISICCRGFFFFSEFCVFLFYFSKKKKEITSRFSIAQQTVLNLEKSKQTLETTLKELKSQLQTEIDERAKEVFFFFGTGKNVVLFLDCWFLI